jgi:hypothetical protein
MRLFSLLLSLSLAAPAAAVAAEGDIALPEGTSWCEPRADVLARFADTNELSDDMVDATGQFAGVDGFYRLVFEDGQLLNMRFRFFESAADNSRVLKELERTLGKGTDAGRGGIVWKPGGGQTVTFKGQSEQMYVDFEVPLERCSGGVVRPETTEREKQDLEALENKSNPAFDPYAMDTDPDKQLVENKKKKEEEEKKKEEKKKDADVGDGDIDW